MSLHLQRLAAEMSLLNEAGILGEWDYEDGEWVRIPAFRLPPGLGQATTDLLIDIPADYPNTPPNGIYVQQHLKLPSHYFERQSSLNRHGDRGWAWYCFHVDGSHGGWRASTNVRRGDNLLIYLKLTRALMDLAVH